jgi:iron complex outermembrane recepter protein
MYVFTYSSKKKISLAVAQTIVAGASIAAALSVSAQTPPTSPTPASPAPQAIEKIEVTGSNIKRVESETSSLVQVISRTDIERTGKQSIAEVLRGITGDNQGSLPTAFSAGFASGAAGVSLRGLGLNSTLVLVNGRRMAPYGLADDGARTFVDLNSIPLEAVDRVEILKDGASAIYGSDAVGGVVNIILRKNYQGFSAGGSLGTSYKNDGQLTRGSGSVGFGDITNDKYNVFLSLEASQERSINQSSRRSYLGTNDLRGIGFFDNRRGAYAAGRGEFADNSGPSFSATNPYGTVRKPGGNLSERINLTACPQINPATGVCLFDLIGYSQIQPETERANFYGRAAFQFAPSAQAYLEVGLFESKTESIGTPSAVADTGVFNPADPTNPTVNRSVLPANHPDNPTGVARDLSLLTTDLGGRNKKTKNNVTRLVGGITGDISGWNYDVGTAYLESKLRVTNTGYVRYSVFQEALNNGTYRINQPGLVSQSLRDAISPVLENTAKNTVALVDFKVSRELMELAGGPLGVAVGAEYRKEKTDSPPVPFTDTADIIGLGYSAFSSNRNVTAFYGEVNAPVLKQLELTAAARTDKYSDYGRSTTPKVGFKFTPIPQIALRGTYSEAFRAPGPTESGNSSSLGFTNIAIISVGDASVKPEKSKSYTFGLLLEPIPGTSASVDYYQVKRRDEITQADQASIIGSAPESSTPNSRIAGAQPNSFVFYDNDGNLSGVLGPYANAAQTKTTGLDINLRHKMKLGDIGTISAEANWTHVMSYKRTLKDGSAFEYAGTQGPYSLSSAAGTPKDKVVMTLAWEKGPYTVSGQMNYVGAMKGIDHDGESLVDNGDGTIGTTTGEGSYFGTLNNGVCGVYYPTAATGGTGNGGPAPGACRISSFTTFDLFAKYTGIKNWEFTASVRNLFNRLPPFNPYTYGGTNYNPAVHQDGAIGTYFTMAAKFTFK